MSRRTFGHVEQRNGGSTWYVRITWKYRTLARAAGPTRAIAQRKLVEIQRLLWEGVSLLDAFDRVMGRKGGEGLTFAEAVTGYLSRYAEIELRPSSRVDYRRRLAVLRQLPWAHRPMRSVTTRDLEVWKEQRLAQGVTVTTVNRELSAISSVWAWARRTGQVAENPVQGVERYSEAGRAREVRLSVAEARALVEACDSRIQALVLCAVHTGMRRGELLSLTWDAVDFERRVITVLAVHSKNHESRVVPMTEALHAILRTLRARRGEAMLPPHTRVFITGTGYPVSERMLYVWFHKAVAACEAIPSAKRQALRFHDLRHTVGSLLGDAGVSAFKIKALLGHKSIQTTQRYVNLSAEANRDTVGTLGTLLAGGTPSPGASAAPLGDPNCR